MDFDNVKRAHAGAGSWFQQLKETLSGNTCSNTDEPGLRWHLDFPSNERPVKVTAAGIVVQGWILLNTEHAEWQQKLTIVAAWESAYELCHPLEIERADVIERVLGASDEGHPQRYCGFRFTVPPSLTRFTLWLACEDQRWLLQVVEINPPEALQAPETLKVLEGKAGWLFLNNDTNASVDQYRGRLRLTPRGLSGWQRYLSAFYALAEKQKAASAVLVAPSKESVMGPRYHPYPEGEGGPIQQLLALPEGQALVYPVNALTALGDDAFIQTDTHWAQPGAMAATRVLAAALGLEESAVADTFADDEYGELSLTGDLGNKLVPERACSIHSLRTFNHHAYRCFDNGLPNFGRLMVLANETALTQGSLLLFGSSSSYSMFNYLARLFKHVVFVHSAGNLDPELVSAVRPDFLVAQTNARFVVQVPKANRSLQALIADKKARLSEDEVALVATRRVDAQAHSSVISSLGLSPWVAA